MYSFLLCLLWFLIVGLILLFFVWIVHAHRKYSYYALKPGMCYVVHGRKYTCPNVTFLSTAYLLTSDYIAELRMLLTFTSRLFATLQIEWCLIGTALLGLVRHNAIPMPFDDQMEVAVDQVHQKFLFSLDFVQAARNCKINVRYLRNVITKVSSSFLRLAPLRLQLLDHQAQVDILFWYKDTKKQLVFKSQEPFAWDDVFPIAKDVLVDDIQVCLPHKPFHVSEVEFGKDALDIVAGSSPLTNSFVKSTIIDALYHEENSM